jgi:MoaA/NifB/PqqE/SkfB family radical SAM enzyme
MDFPQCISLTITNACNLRCRMCGQWSRSGYMHTRKERLKNEMVLSDWKRVVDEVAAHKIRSILLRGGEPFLFPGIIELIKYINSKDIRISIDTNGTMLWKYAEEFAGIGNVHISVSVDGPEKIHDRVRSVEGCFKKIKKGIGILNELERDGRGRVDKLLVFTISRYSVAGLGEMPDVARSMSVDTVSIYPYYYFPSRVGRQYEKELKQNFNCAAFSWKGFHHESSGVDFEEFKRQYRKYLENLKGIKTFPYMYFSEEDYRIWFSDPTAPVGPVRCLNVEKLIDIQPSGDANFCVDFPDYIFGNVRKSSIEEVWNSKEAEIFRIYRRGKPFSICHRCGAKYMAECMS